MNGAFLLPTLLLAFFCTIPGLTWAGDPPGLRGAPGLPSPTLDTDSTLIWKAGYRLTWDDFRASAPDTDPLHALTSSDLDVQVSCENDRLEVAVQAVFRPLESWSKSRDSDPLLHHEQLHFDLTEVHARLLRQLLLKAHLTCDAARLQLKPMIDAAFTNWQKEQDRYDHETNHGLDRAAQARWEATVKTRLEKLPK